MTARLTSITLLCAVFLLSGCALTPRVDADVQSFAKWSPPPAKAAPVRYRFERLLSQQEGSGAEDQARLEAHAKTVLTRHGWQEVSGPSAEATLAVSLQLTTVVSEEFAWRGIGGFGGPGMGWGAIGPEYVVTRGGQVILLPHRSLVDGQFYQREITVAVRDLATQATVFESRGKHDSRSNHMESLVPLLVDAVLDGFPNPPAGKRRVTRIELPNAASSKP